MLRLMGITSTARACKLISWKYVLVHALMAEIVVTLVETSPKYLVSTKVLHFTRVAKNETEVQLPTCFLTMWIQTMTIWARNSYI